ncbi:MAG: DNA/RNA nuclease SfsA [Caldilineaceae bacterium]
MTTAATFLDRPNRYRVVARLHESGAVIQVHCPNPGRLGELLIPGATVHVSPAAHQDRKTAFDLRFVEHPENGQLVSLDTRLPNQLVAEGLQQRFFAPLTDYTTFKQEVTLPHGRLGNGKSAIRSRIDFQLFDMAGAHCWVEVKSVSLVVDGCARFPDAVTARGRRHVLELAELARQGEPTAVIFIVQRADATLLRPQWETDPDFGEALVTANAQGVALYAYTCSLTCRHAHLHRPIPINLEKR